MYYLRQGPHRKICTYLFITHPCTAYGKVLRGRFAPTDSLHIHVLHTVMSASIRSWQIAEILILSLSRCRIPRGLLWLNQVNMLTEWGFDR